MTGLPASSDKNFAISRRRVIQGAAWATPAILIATAAPAFAVSTDQPTVSLTATAVRSASTIAYTVTLALTTPPTGTYITNGYTITVAPPRPTFIVYGADPVGWTRTGNVFTRTGGTLTAPGSVQLAFSGSWGSAVGLNGSITTFSLAGSSGGGAVSKTATATSN